ncbi:helix-turn-helix domain-containing protein [Amycolatopsis jejuensis]|uniref:helix-turn-helix domain-containing protein n=1 Tax=Amycolatopsis jejuensis TaxID=330084 RepID=UPI000524998C|nr:helix-turn-helix domain-containing protein [Amycolatopsis jejuensis]
MKELAIRLSELDPEAGAAVNVIGYFDVLVASRAGLQSIVGGAAELAGCAARLVDPGRSLDVRMSPDGVATPAGSPPEPTWPSAPVTSDGALLWLETAAPVGTLQSVVLERAATAARMVIERVRARRAEDDPASLELVLDAKADVADRLAASRRLRLPPTGRAVALADGSAIVIDANAAPPAGQRAGIGPAVPAERLPQSWAAARVALRLTAEGTDADPGPQVVEAESLGALGLVVTAADAARGPIPDVAALQHAADAGQWTLVTLATVADAASLRDAARALHIHHSTLHDRLTRAESLLGWNVRDPRGRLRLQLALAMRRALRNRS